VARPILFLTDYGLGDEFVGVCHAVIARLAPDARVIDLTHGVPAGNVLAGALALESAVPYAPPHAVFLAVVDPGVGTERRAVAVEAGDAALVGPDNGLLDPAVRRLGGGRRAVTMDPSLVSPGPVSATFHGRDVFAPAAAILARGGSLDELGTDLDPASLGRATIPQPSVSPGRLEATVIGIDRFGNVRLGARPTDLDRAGLRGSISLAGIRDPVQRIRTFGDLEPEGVGILEDSSGWLALVRNGSSAAEALGLAPYDRVTLDVERRPVG
jgi:S-adenosyl-L-methionine hydrolase (adenosine-forming)